MPRPDPLTTLATPDHWMVVQFGDSPAYVAEPVEFGAFARPTDGLIPVPCFADKAAAIAAIRVAHEMIAADLAFLLGTI